MSIPDYASYTIADWIIHAYGQGYDDCLNGGSLNYEPIDNDVDRSYRKGWQDAMDDSIAGKFL